MFAKLGWFYIIAYFAFHFLCGLRVCIKLDLSLSYPICLFISLKIFFFSNFTNKDLLIHLDKWYVPHVEALLEICKEERFGESQDSSTKEQIDRICSDVVYPDDIELNEKRVKKDFSNFRSWRCIVPDEYESEIIRAEGECQSPIGKQFFYFLH